MNNAELPQLGNILCSLKLRIEPDLTKGPLLEVTRITSVDIEVHHGSLSTSPLSHYQQTCLSQAKVLKSE